MKKIFLLTILIIIYHSIFSQTVLPDPPEFLSASIIPESDPLTVELNWNPSDSTSVIGYIIYKVEGITTELSYIDGRFNTSFLYSESDADSSVERYRLASFDTDTNRSMLTDPHQTMHMSLELDKCNDFVDLEWTEYEGWDDNLINYKIYRRSESSDYSQIATLDSDETTYTDNTVENETIYYYYIEALNSNGTTATSNSRKVYTESYSAPSFIYAQSASVIDDNIQVRFRVDNTAEVLEYRIQRSLSEDGAFINVKSIPNSNQSEITWIDSDVNVDDTKYFYRLISLNPCAVESGKSNIASNIIIKENENMNLYHSFYWSEYFQWKYGVDNYKIFRSFDNTDAQIGTSTSSTLNYTYSIEDYVNEMHKQQNHITNKFCYYVVAYENYSNNPSGVQGRSRSNKVCFFQEPVVYIPNAINTTSLTEQNRVFKPILSFIEKEPYELIIMDRAGFEIFRTNNTYEGWDGVIRYTVAPPQKYLYILRYFDHQGQEYKKTGSFIIYNE